MGIHIRFRTRTRIDVELRCDLCPCVSFIHEEGDARQWEGLCAVVRDGARAEGFEPLPLFAIDGAPAGTGDVCRNCRTIRRSGRWRKRR